MAQRDDRLTGYLKEYVKYYRSFFANSLEGNEQGRRYSARKIRELNQSAETILSTPHLERYRIQRDSFRRQFFERFRGMIISACAKIRAAHLDGVA